MKKILALTLSFLATAACLHAQDAVALPRTAAPEGAEAYIISPKDGETVHGAVHVLFGLKGMGVAPAGIDLADTGHHHLLIDVDELPSLDMPLPATEHVVHFGKGQTETVLHLPSGEHTLQLVLGDKLHIPHQPPVISKKITITVVDGDDSGEHAGHDHSGHSH